MIIRMATDTDNLVSLIFVVLFGLFGLSILIGLIYAWWKER